jgi:hypothetical protein
MQKTAQKRNVLDWVSEKTNVGGTIAESAPFLNQPGFKELMDKLRDTDDKARSIALGEAVGTGDEPEDTMSLQEMLKKAKSMLARREYMKCVAYLGRFHDKVKDVSNAFKNFTLDVRGIHQKFLTEDLDEDTVKHISNIKSRMEKKEASYLRDSLIKEAKGDRDMRPDFFVNLFTNRGQALGAWEKRYPKKSKELRRATEIMLNQSNTLFDKLLRQFDKMSSARNKRMIEDYVSGAQLISNLFTPYDLLFKDYYTKNVKEWADIIAAQPPQVAPNPEDKIRPEQVESARKPLESIDPRVESSEPASSGKSISKDPSVATPGGTVMTGLAPSKPGNFVPGGETKTQGPSAVYAPDTLKDPSVRIPAPGLPTPSSIGLPVDTSQRPTATSARTDRSPPPSSEEGISSPVPNFGGAFEASEHGDVAPTALNALREKEGKPPISIAKKIIDSLEKLSGESPLVLKSYLMKYAKAINKSDPKTANILISVANRIEV